MLPYTTIHKALIYVSLKSVTIILQGKTNFVIQMEYLQYANSLTRPTPYSRVRLLRPLDQKTKRLRD